MEVIVFQKEAYERLQEELFLRFHETLLKANKAAKTLNKEWLSTQEALDFLGFKSRTKLLELRDQGLIEYSQYGRMVKYSRKSILDFVENHRRSLP
ncbi:MAG: helix-turn-helix domain-containing protein [Bacteroidota bacterium]